MVYRGLTNPWPYRHFNVQAVNIDINGSSQDRHQVRFG